MRVWFYPKPPGDLVAFYSVPEIQKGKTSYAKWGDKYPGVGTIASRLPNWPRPVRLIIFLLFWFLLIGLFIKVC